MSDARQRIHNALSIIESPKAREPHQLPRTLELAAESLRAADRAIDELEETLDLVATPDLDAARELADRRRELQVAREKVTRLERELAAAREELSIEQRVHAEERKQLADLQARVKKFDQLLLDDDRAFDRFMDRELGGAEGQKRKRRE